MTKKLWELMPVTRAIVRAEGGPERYWSDDGEVEPPDAAERVEALLERGRSQRQAKLERLCSRHRQAKEALEEARSESLLYLQSEEGEAHRTLCLLEAMRVHGVPEPEGPIEWKQPHTYTEGGYICEAIIKVDWHVFESFEDMMAFTRTFNEIYGCRDWAWVHGSWKGDDDEVRNGTLSWEDGT